MTNVILFVIIWNRYGKGREKLKEITDRFIIFVLNAIMVLSLGVTEMTIIAVVTTFCFMGISFYTKKISVKNGLICAEYGLMMAFPLCSIFLPSIAYDLTEMFCEVRKKVLIYVCMAIYIIIFIFRMQEYNIYIVVANVVLTLLAIWLCIGTRKYIECKNRLIMTRDNDEQLRIELERRNKLLIANQDNEIYMARLKERNRIAREIHDNVGHMLSRSILQVGAAKTVNKDEKLAPILAGLHETLDTAMTNVRSSVHDLHDESIDLEVAVKEAVGPITDRDVKLIYDVTQYIDRRVKYCIIGVLKESVANIIKHSNATVVEIMIREHPAFYQLVINDNGTGVTMTEPGIGLINMRERVEALNGNFNVSNESGFKIFAIIPKENSK